MVFFQSDEIRRYQCHFFQYPAAADGDGDGGDIYFVQHCALYSDFGEISVGDGGGRFYDGHSADIDYRRVFDAEPGNYWTLSCQNL